MITSANMLRAHYEDRQNESDDPPAAFASLDNHASARLLRTLSACFLALGSVGASGCQAAIIEDAPGPVDERSSEPEAPAGEIIPDAADAPPITVSWILENPDAITELALEAPVVRVRIASTSPEPALVSGVWTVEHAGAASRVALQPFSLDAGATHDLSLDLAGHCDLQKPGSAPGAVWLSLLADSSGQLFQEGETKPTGGWIHPGTESLRFWVAGEHVQVLPNRSLSRAQADGTLDEVLLTALYPRLSPEDLAALQAGEIVEVVQWVPPSDEEQGLLNGLAEQMKGEGG